MASQHTLKPMQTEEQLGLIVFQQTDSDNKCAMSFEDELFLKIMDRICFILHFKECLPNQLRMLNSMFNVGEIRFISVFLCLCLMCLRSHDRGAGHLCVCLYTSGRACVLTSCGS